MTDSALDKFLEIGLLPGTDDDSLSKLDVASGIIATNLNEDLSILRRYACAILDSDLSDNDVTLESVEEVVQSEWRSLRNAFPTRPVNLLRAVITEAITRTVKQDDWRPAAIVWLTGSSLLPHANLGRERSLLENIYQDAGIRAEEYAIASWQSSSSTERNNINLANNPEISLHPSLLDEANLAGHLKAAAGPQQEQNQPSGANANPYWPQNQHFHLWGGTFGNRAANGIKAVVDASLSDLTSNLEKAFATNTVALNKSIISAMNDQREVANTKAKLDLLWWKQALYSSSLRCGYREIEDPLVASFFIALDLRNQFSGLHPQSVEYFLREVVRDVLNEHMRSQHNLIEFSTSLSHSKEVSDALINEPCTPSARMPLLSFIAQLDGSDATAKTACDRVGIAEGIKLHADDYAVWLFRDMQADNLAKKA